MAHGAVKAALFANGSIAIAKTVAAIVTGSSSMLAEAIHSFADCGNQLLLLLGMNFSTKKATADHPLGFGTASYFWSFIVALVLFSLGGCFAIYEGIHKLNSTEPLKYTYIAMGILLFSIVAESKSLKVCFNEIKSQTGSLSLWKFFKNSRESELLVILCEDIAALSGLTIALFFLIIAQITGNPLWDAIGSICVGIILIIVAMVLFKEIYDLLIGQSIEPTERKELYQFLYNQEEIEHIYDVLTLQRGDSAILLLRVRMREKECAKVLLYDINTIETKIKAQFPVFNWIWVEPETNSESE